MTAELAHACVASVAAWLLAIQAVCRRTGKNGVFPLDLVLLSKYKVLLLSDDECCSYLTMSAGGVIDFLTDCQT